VGDSVGLGSGVCVAAGEAVWVGRTAAVAVGIIGAEVALGRAAVGLGCTEEHPAISRIEIRKIKGFIFIIPIFIHKIFSEKIVSLKDDALASPDLISQQTLPANKRAKQSD
jgi:hypothetical protein